MTDYTDDLISEIAALLEDDPWDAAAYPRGVTVGEYALNIATEDDVRRVAKQVAVKPACLIAAGEPTAIPEGEDSTAEMSLDSVPVEVFVALSFLRDPMEQKKKCRALAFEVRNRLQGRSFHTEEMSDSVIRFEGIEHIGTQDDLTIYSVMLRVEGLVSVS